LAARGPCHLDPNDQNIALDFSANASRSQVVIALIRGFLPHTITAILVSSDAPAMAKGKLFATSGHARVQDFQAEADGLSLRGSFVLSPS